MVLIRYRRSAIGTSLVALLVGVLVALLIMTTSSASGTSRGVSQPSAVATSRATVLIRPVLCFAYPYAANQRKDGPLPACDAPYRLTTAELNVRPNTSAEGFGSTNVGPDPGLAGYQSTTRDTPGRSVLLSGLDRIGSASGAERYLLGPSEMRLIAANVASVVAQKNHFGEWIVKIHLTPAGAATWDRVANENFHQLLAIDMGGKVVSAPIIQPTYASFKSFNGSIEVSGGLTAANARALAAAVKG